MLFVNAKIGGALMDFEGFVDADDSFWGWDRLFIKGTVGDQLPAQDTGFNMLWEVGNSVLQPQETLHCSYDNSTCYTTKTVPVI